MKTTSRHAVRLLAVIALGLAGSQATTIPLNNPSLESGGPTWRNARIMPNDFDGWSESGPTGKASVAHTGSFGLWNCSGYGWNSLFQQSGYTVAAVGETITASVWAKTDANLGSRWASFNLTLKVGSDWAAFAQPAYQGGQDWTQVTTSYVTTAADIGKVVGISFGTDGGLGGGNPGYVFMDDPSLSTVPSAGTVTLVWAATESYDWNLSTPNWTQDATPAIWTNGVSTAAEFGTTGAGRSVMLTEPIEANSLVFNVYGYDLSGGRLTLNGPAPRVTANQPVTISSEIAGSVGLAKQGSANLTLAGVNTYSGGTIIYAGAVTVGDAATSGNLGAGDVVNNGSLVFDRADAVTVAGIISGTGSLTQQGLGSVLLTAVNTYTGPTTINGGTLTITGSGELYDGNVAHWETRHVAVNPGATLEIDRWTGVGCLGIVDYAAGNLVLNGGTLRYLGSEVTTPAFIDSFSGKAFTLGSNGGTLDSAAPAGKVFAITQYSTDPGVYPLPAFNSTLTLSGAGDGYLSKALSGTGGVTKTGTGTWTLAANNSYRGDTTVNAGRLVLATGGSLSFYPTANQVSNWIFGTGSPVVTLNGTLYLDLAGADLTGGNTWTIVDVATVAASFSGSVTSSLGSFNNTAGVWKLVKDGWIWTFSQATGQLALESDPFGSWINATWPLLADKTPAGDSDDDGIPNLLEYVLQNGDPSLSSAAILPTASAAGNDLVFTFHRRHASTADTTQVFQYGSDLSGWTEVPLSSGGMVSITPDTPAAGIDEVIVTVPQNGNPSLFGRLKVSK